MVPTLRDYQATAVDGVRREFAAKRRRVLLVSPTGSGKTHMFSHVARGAAAKSKRILIVAHRREIIEQISGAIAAMDVPHGLIVPGAELTDDPVQVGMVQTVARRLDKLAPFDMLIVDEAHHSTAGQWRAVAAWHGDRHVLGVTATPERLDGKGLDDVFDVIVEGPQTAALIAEGHLCGFTYLAPPPKADLSGIPTKMGDYQRSVLASTMDRPTVTGDAVAHYAKHAPGAPAIAFCVSVEHAEHVADAFRAAGWRAASVDGSMDPEERRQRINGLATGQIQVLTSCELISEGVDVPVVRLAILLRPTQSLAMFLQQIGRILRKKPDGSGAIILDHVGNVTRHGLPDAPRTWSLKGRDKKEKAPSNRTCALCFAVFPPRATVECEQGSDCGLLEVAEGGGRGELRVVKGELVAVNPIAWARGIDLKNGNYFRLRDLAAGRRDRLKMIADARGYKRGWVSREIDRHAAILAHESRAA